MDAGMGLTDCLREPALVAGVQVAEQQADRDRVAVEPADLLGDALAFLLRQRGDDAAGADPLANPDPQLRRRQRRRPVGAEAVEVDAVLARDLEQVGEALGGDQRRCRAAPLEQRVGCLLYTSDAADE